MNNQNNTKESREEFFKTRVENIGLNNKLVSSLIANNIRTAGGITNRSKSELKSLLNISGEDVEQLLKKVDAAHKVAQTENQLALFSDVNESTLDRVSVAVDLDDDDDIIETLSKFFGYEKEQIIEHSRKQEVVRIRDLIIYMLREYGDMSYPGIGRLIGRDHTTIIHAHKKIRKQVQTRPEMEAGLTEIIGKVKEIKARKLRIQESLIPKILGESLGGSDSLPLLPVRREIPERNLKILELYREGLTYGNIGKVFDVSRERIRQIVIRTIVQMAVNESIDKGIVMDSDVLAEEELKKRKLAQESKRISSRPSKIVEEHRWSRYYLACRSCGTTAIPHVRKGLCEQCIGQFRAERREEIIAEHGNKCYSCGRNRYEATAAFGRDFYITKDRQVLCQECFRSHSGKVLGSYKHHAWSRHYEKCLNCGTTTVPHMKKGLCENCSDSMTSAKREQAISANGSKCNSCGIFRGEAKKKYGKDLYVVKSGATLCRPCFQKYAKGGMRNAKLQKQLREE